MAEYLLVLNAKTQAKENAKAERKRLAAKMIELARVTETMVSAHDVAWENWEKANNDLELSRRQVDIAERREADATRQLEEARRNERLHLGEWIKAATKETA